MPIPMDLKEADVGTTYYAHFYPDDYLYKLVLAYIAEDTPCFVASRVPMSGRACQWSVPPGSPWDDLILYKNYWHAYAAKLRSLEPTE